MDDEGKADHPDWDAAWDRDERGETTTQRLDRNWADLLQELRVVQTGVQLLTGFLLTLPFQARFAQLDDFQQLTYLFTVACSVGSTGVLIAPVSVHRILFRRHERRQLVTIGHRLALVGLTLLGSAVTGVVLLIFDVLRGRTVGLIAGLITTLLLLALWVLLPWSLRRSTSAETQSLG
jgi:hypothetical protein